MSAQPPPDTIYSFKGNQTEVHCLNFVLNSTQEKLLSGTRNGDVFVWDLETKSLSHSFRAGEGPCISVLVPGDDNLITHNRGDAIRKWTVRPDGTYEERICVKSSCLQFCSAQLLEADSTREKLVVYPDGDSKTIKVHDLTHNEVICSLEYSDQIGNIMGMSPAGNGRIMAVFEARDLLFWDIRKSTPSHSYKMAIGDEEMNTAMCLAFNSDKSIGVVGSSIPQIETFTLTENSEICALPTVSITNPGINQFSFRKDNKLLGAAGWDSAVRIYSVRSADSKIPIRALAVLPSYTEDKGLSCIMFSPIPVNSFGNKFILAAAGEGCTVCLWDIYN